MPWAFCHWQFGAQNNLIESTYYFIFFNPLIILIQFKELKDALFEQCANYPYLLINVHNILARFQLDEIAGYLLGQVCYFLIKLI